ncbi:MAG: putative DNA binding domain-containing protein [Deltaproteobacteria bacterium]|nr:putative DNA binding domain-containing protein [Deltaproteobacteria bacterium]
MAKLTIAQLVQEGEGYLVEFKESPAHLEKEMTAFANANGGTIYIGISDRGKIVPIALTNRLRAQIQAAARSCEPPPGVQLGSHGPLIAVHVQESSDKPVRAPNGFFLRIGASSQKLTRNEIFAFAVKEAKILFDTQLYVEHPANELLNIRQLEHFRDQARLEINVDNLTLLENLGCLKRQKQTPYLTYAGILLFSQDPQKIFPHAIITMLHMEDVATIAEQKIFGGTLLHQVEQAFRFLTTHLRSHPSIETLRRSEHLELPESVLRELLVNAVVHRDYFERSADVTVKILPDSIEFSNPGRVSDHIPLDAVYGKSYRRNPMIADLFYRARYIERAGTGLLRVKKVLNDLGLPDLRIEEEGPFVIATLTRRTGAFIRAELTDRQQQFMQMPSTFFPFSAAAYARHFCISERAARLDIKSLVQKKILITIRHGRHIRYALA